jgi:hypothetical protein
MTSQSKARQERAAQPPSSGMSWDDVLRTLGDGQQPPAQALPPIPANLPAVDPANPFMQQIAELPTLLTSALVEATSSLGVREQRAVITWRNNSTTLTTLASREQLAQWIQTLQTIHDEFSSLVTAVRVVDSPY